MGKQKTGREYVNMKQMLSLQDQRLKEKDRLKSKKKEKKDPSILKEREVPPTSFLLILPILHTAGPTLPHPGRYQLYQFFH
uniref:Uncharacterized protein n=1 Tax=Canis lupus dingo TaxID=286419 RepID=A0A8C0JTH5_CANLU